MSKNPTTIRLDPTFYKKVAKEAEKAGLSFSSVVNLLLRAFVQGTVHIGVTQYPEKYMKTIEKESADLSRLYQKGKMKGYSTSKELFNDILSS